MPEDEILNIAFKICDSATKISKLTVLAMQHDGTIITLRAGAGLTEEERLAEAAEEELAVCFDKHKVFLRSLAEEHPNAISLGWSVLGATGSLTTIWNGKLGKQFVVEGWRDDVLALARLIATSLPVEAREIFLGQLAKIDADNATR